MHLIVLRPATTDGGQLPVCLFGEVATVRPGALGIIRNEHLARLANSAHGKLRVIRRAELTHQHHIQIAIQCIGNHPTERHAAARNRQNQRVRFAVSRQRFRQLLSGIEAISEDHHLGLSNRNNSIWKDGS